MPEHPATIKDQKPRASVFFDGGCPLCRREIAHYQRLDARHGSQIDWLDIHADPQLAQARGLEWAAAMQRMHVIDTNGRLQTGAAAFVALWCALPYYRVPGQLLERLPWVVRMLDAGYSRFARRRWQRRCADGVCGVIDPAADRETPNATANSGGEPEKPAMPRADAAGTTPATRNHAPP